MFQVITEIIKNNIQVDSARYNIRLRTFDKGITTNYTLVFPRQELEKFLKQLKDLKID